MFTQSLLFATVLPLTQAAETVLGVYIFSRHGDRTAKSTPPANLTDLGYSEVFTSGTYFRDRYVDSDASSRIAEMNSDLVKLSQISVSAPWDNVLMSSATGFLQGLYPPVGTALGTNTLRNGSTVQAPLDGYQIIPIQQTTSGTGSEDSAWLQGASNCANAIISSNNYFLSEEYLTMLNSTKSFYTSLSPMINRTFADNQTSFKNAYTIFDLLNVASIHNSTTQSPALSALTPSILSETRTLADTHEYNLAYNASDPIRAIAGKTLAAQIVQGLNSTISSMGKTKMTIQFGAYGSFQSFFGLANLTATNPDFYGVPDYSSTMTFELFTAVAPSPFPSVDDLQVRFLFHNHTTSNSSAPVVYPLFGGSATSLSWADFEAGMNKFAVGTQGAWCTACGNTTGVCAGTDDLSSSGPGSPSGSASSASSGSGMSLVVAGVVGAMVTLAVILGLEAMILLLAGLRVVSKKRIGGGVSNGHGGAAKAG